MAASRTLSGILALLVFFSLSLSAQVKETSETLCEELLTEARQQFDAGQLTQIDEAGLANCMRSQSREYFSRASKLLILTHLYLDHDSIARRLLVALLRTNPEFSPDPSDPRELKSMYEEYNTVPILMTGVMIGGNLADAELINRYSLGNTAESEVEFQSVSSFQYRFTLARQLTSHWFLETGLTFAERRFRFQEKLVTDPNPDISFATVSFIEHQQWWDLPLSIQYQFSAIPLPLQGRLVPYISGGISTHVLVNPRFDGFRRLADNRNENNPPQIELTTLEEKISIRDRRRFFDGGVHLGLGVMSKLKLGYLVLDVRYRHGLRSLPNPATRYGSDEERSGEILYLFGYVDNDFAMRDFSLSIGYIRNFYSPELTRKARKLKEKFPQKKK